MFFGDGIGDLLSFVKNLSESDKKKLKEMSKKISKLDNEHKRILFNMLTDCFEDAYKDTISHQKTVKNK